MVVIFFVFILLFLAVLIWILPYIILAAAIGIPIYITYRVIKRYRNHSFVRRSWRFRSSTQKKKTPPYQGEYYSKGEEELLTGRKCRIRRGNEFPNHYQNQVRDKLLVKSMLESIGLSEGEAKFVFGKDWKRKLAKSRYDDQFASEILKIQTKLMFDLDYREKILLGDHQQTISQHSHIIDKLISTIDFIIDAFPETAEKYAENMGPYEEIYIHQWKVFKKHKKTSFEIYSENKLTKAEAYNILELSENATYQQVKKKYRELAKKWHPDKNETEKKSVAEQMFVSITKAYETITAAA